MIHHHSSVVEILIRNLLNARQVLVAGVMAGFGGGAAADINRIHVRKLKLMVECTVTHALNRVW